MPGTSSKSTSPPADDVGFSHLEDAALVSPEGDEESAEVESQTWESRTVVAGVDEHGMRLDKALALWVPEFSRSYLQALLLQGAVLVNGKSGLKPSAKVKAGDQAVVELRPTQQSQAFLPQDIPLDVVYQDEHLLIINKPAGMVVHPAPGNWSGTLLNALLAYDAKAAQLPRAGIVHRLDKDTSGLMVVARERQTMDALVKLIALGNLGWVAASFAVVVIFAAAMTGLGIAVVVAQAFAVLGFAFLEWKAVATPRVAAA